MKNTDKWTSTKFQADNSGLHISRDTSKLRIDSRIAARLVAKEYSRLIPTYCKGALLDLGCGNVPMYGYYRDYVDTVVCADWDNSTHSNIHLDDVVDLNIALPYADNSFDTVICSDVLEHLPDPKMVCSEIARVLRPGGHALINVPFLYPLHEKPYDYHRYTEFKLALLAAEASLLVLEFNSLGGIHHVVGLLIGKSLPHRFGGSLARRCLNTLVNAIDLSGLGKRLARRTSSTMPLSYIAVWRCD